MSITFCFLMSVLVTDVYLHCKFIKLYIHLRFLYYFCVCYLSVKFAKKNQWHTIVLHLQCLRGKLGV